MLTKTKAANLPEYLLSYREHEHQISSIYREDQLAMSSDILRSYLKRLDSEIPDRFIQLFTVEKLKVQHTGTRLIHLNGFYLYCLEKNIFDEKVLSKNVLALYRETFFQLKSISINDLKQVLNTELFKSLGLTLKQRLRFYFRVVPFIN